MKKSCFFCQKNLQPKYKDVERIAKFTTDRGKILSRSKTGLCQKHQKRLARAVKRARYLALLAYVSRL